jgi:membrane protein DedA with SNARE-associated domain
MAAYLESLLHTYGYAAIFVIIALENAGFPLPGETILITSAIFAARTREMNVSVIVATAALAAFSGSVGGFILGRYGERHLLRRYAHYVHIDERDLRLGRYLFQRYGGRVVLVARFVAFLREVDSLLAGMNRMGWRRFLAASSAGAAAWSATFGFSAYALGDRIESLSTRAGLLIGAVVLLAAVAGFRFLRHNRARLQREADQVEHH